LIPQLTPIAEWLNAGGQDQNDFMKKLADLEKWINKQQFKLERLEYVKETLAIMLEESVQELEKKSGDLAHANQSLLKAMESLQTHAADLEEQKKQVELEKARSEKLLHDILPSEVVRELNAYGRSYARKYNEVSVLFADIRDFSSITEQLSPSEVVTLLDDYFRGFDHIMEKYGMEKIKTIGDAYMCVSGLFGDHSNTAVTAIQAATDMFAFAVSLGQSKKIQGLPAFEFRIGIHTGPVVGGVIGMKKFAFDIWGDTVNMATRLEQNGETGRINISAASYELVKERFSCSPRGTIRLKNGREMEMYFVEWQIAEM
jgi:class 3 adenylate cyclase